MKLCLNNTLSECGKSDKLAMKHEQHNRPDCTDSPEKSNQIPVRTYFLYEALIHAAM